MKEVERMILDKLKEIHEIMCEFTGSNYISMCIMEDDSGKCHFMANNRHWVGGEDEFQPINLSYIKGEELDEV